MGIKRKNSLSISMMGILLGSLIIPAYAEVQSVQTDRLFYTVGDEIIFSGTVNEDSSGLVTIVIRDSNDKFVLLTQALIQPDNTFNRGVDVNTKFSDHGIYNATAFLVNMTEGSQTRFDFSIDGSPVVPSVSNTQSKTNESVIQEPNVTNTPEPEPNSKIASFIDPEKDPQYYVDRYNNEPKYKEWFDTNFPGVTVQEAIGLDVQIKETPIVTSKIPGFPDPEKDPQYYVDRYNNEPKYKEWFDTNFPKQSIYEVVGVTIQKINNDKVNSTINEPPFPTQESTTSIIESSKVSPNIDSGSAEFGQMLLALGGLGVLFGAVYGVKRRVDTNSEQIEENKLNLEKKVSNNSEQISQNRFWLKKKLLSLKSNSEPVSLIKERLAKGEISVEQYYKLLRALKK
jgi:hypothetical protein